MNVKVCVPYDNFGKTNPSINPGPTGTCGSGMVGCFPSPYGACAAGAASENPLPGPDTYYFATGSSNYCCLSGEESVRLANGSCKLVKDVVVGDELAGCDASGNRRPQTVVSLISGIQPCLKVIFEGGEFTCSESHEVMIQFDQAIQASSLTPDHGLITEDGQRVAILAIEKSEESVVFGWSCEPDHIFYGAGILQHNKKHPTPQVGGVVFAQFATPTPTPTPGPTPTPEAKLP